MKYGFIVDTNQYSGNFERQMCAYMTGHVGDCGTGERESIRYLEEGYEPIKIVIDVPNEYGLRRPVKIETTPNVWNNGLGFEYVKGEERLALENYKDYVREEKLKKIEIVESHRGKNIPSWTDDAIEQEIKRCKEEIKETEKKTSVEKIPAYCSIRIYMNEKPAKEIISFLKQRAYQYSDESEKGLKITGFRLAIGKKIINL